MRNGFRALSRHDVLGPIIKNEKPQSGTIVKGVQFTRSDEVWVVVIQTYVQLLSGPRPVCQLGIERLPAFNGSQDGFSTLPKQKIGSIRNVYGLGHPSGQVEAGNSRAAVWSWILLAHRTITSRQRIVRNKVDRHYSFSPCANGQFELRFDLGNFSGHTPWVSRSPDQCGTTQAVRRVQAK